VPPGRRIEIGIEHARDAANQVGSMFRNRDDIMAGPNQSVRDQRLQRVESGVQPFPGETSSSHFATVFGRMGSATPEMTICWHARPRLIQAQMSGHHETCSVR
jgi:hypothetical protein